MVASLWSRLPQVVHHRQVLTDMFFQMHGGGDVYGSRTMLWDEKRRRRAADSTP